MSADNATILEGFNSTFTEFLGDIQNIFPDDFLILDMKNKASLTLRTDKQMIMLIWKYHIVGKYQNEIMAGNIDFFLIRDYRDDLKTVAHAGRVIEIIDAIRDKVRLMSPVNRGKTVEYMQLLTKLAFLYQG